jgi:mono/diheme cytochrome c family protein
VRIAIFGLLIIALLSPATVGAQQEADVSPAETANAASAPADAAAKADGGEQEGAVPAAAKDLFVTKCASCHSVGDGPRVGPDLKGVHDRRDAGWIKKMIQTPSKLLDSDADARKLLAEFKNVRMPDLGLSDEQTQTLSDLLATCSAVKCDLKGKFVPVTNATHLDVALGLDLFMGVVPFKSGAPACISCHSMEGTTGILGGGKLAKDLTNAFAGLGDEGLDAALRSPAFPLMNKVFGDKPLDEGEAFALRSAMYEANRGNLGGKGSQPISVILVALVAAALALAALNAAWSRPKREGIHKAVLANVKVSKKEQHS